MMASEVRSMLSEGSIEVGPGKKRFHIPLHDLQKMRKAIFDESKAAELIHNLHKIQNDHPETDLGSQSLRVMSSLTQH